VLYGFPLLKGGIVVDSQPHQLSDSDERWTDRKRKRVRCLDEFRSQW